MPPDRLAALTAPGQTAITGIDFVRVDEDQVQLDVYFLTDPTALDTSLEDLDLEQLRIHSPALPDVEILTHSFVFDAASQRNVLRLQTAAPGGFADYRLFIDDARIDRFFNDVQFSFKANCPTPFDCEAPPHECPPEEVVDFPVDTQARDFWSLRKALLDFAAQRYPHWQDRLEADVGIMLAEVMSHLGDEMAYYQDRIAREAALETAAERRSLRRHARLVDYVIHDGLGATTWLDVQVNAAASLPAGTDVWAESNSGTIEAGEFVPRRIMFEVGRGLAETLAGQTYAVDPDLNSFDGHIWDETETCLPVGATEVWVDGHHAADLPIGKVVVLQTDPIDPAIPARRHLVRLIAAINETDPLAVPLGIIEDVTRLVWDAAEGLPFEMDLQARFTVRANIVPATAGQTRQTPFSIGPSSQPVPGAVERTGANGSVAFLFTLADPDGEGLVWHAGPSGDPRSAEPEVSVVEATWSGTAFVPGESWTWRRALVGVVSSQPRDTHYTLDDGTWARVVGYQRLGGEIVHVDYQNGAGVSLRFGDGEFGQAPARGSGVAADDQFFLASWRLGNGVKGNVAAGTITRWDRGTSLGFIDSITNPLPAADGLEPESAADVKRFAPDAFRTLTYRAVRPEDYAEAAQRLPWVQRAGATLRWTGSWLSCFVTADPHDAAELPPARRAELARWLDRFRQAGREVHVLAPRYADVDLEITICVEPTSYPGDVLEAVLVALFGKGGPRPRRGFFHPDRFTFGTPLDRSELEAAIQAVTGVRAVEGIQIRRRGWFDWRAFVELSWQPADDEVIRIENDPLNPGRGTVRLFSEGGA